jgi:L-threonylcarbamoyladenylate synthase
MPAALPPARPRILRPTPRNLARLASALRRGEIVGVPSETVYGLAADALSADACARIFEAKGRPTTDPLIVHLAHARELARVAETNPAALALAEACWPGPLTLVLPKKREVPDLVTAGRSSVAVRVPAHPLFRKLIRLTGRPLAAPSANLFGYVSPTSARHVVDGLAGSALRFVLEGGECSVGVESTILDLTKPARPRLLRPGGLAIERIEAILGLTLPRPRPARVASGVAAPAPGMLARHYSPRTPLTLHDRLDEAALARLPTDEAALLLRRPTHATLRRDPRLRWLSRSGELAEVARELFAALRELDTAGWSRLHAEVPAGAEGLAPAIRDRLTRAAAKR